ncbi:MAG: hypothetical protein JST00_13035 [Deltaproteobacteria bacterium]|nr:hypothetical protein [Deltaproteobacteria bacterium]
MEEHRRTEAGRVRTAKEFLGHFFPHDGESAKDQVFRHMPNDVRGPILSGWGIRGAKAALKDDDEKVRFVVHDALVAGDLDDATFESGITAQILVDWIVLAEWWSFWRHGRLTGVAIQKALATARELALIDDKWFLLNVQGRGGKLKGTDVLCDTLSKDQIVAWVRKLHESGDGSPAGIIAAIGWETVLQKTAQDALLFALDQFARKAGLAVEEAKPTSQASPTSVTPSSEATSQRGAMAESHPTVAAPQDAAALAEAEALRLAQKKADREKTDDGLDVAIPDIPAMDGNDDEPPSIPSVEERALWGGGATADESPKLAEARAAMMATLMQTGTDADKAPPSKRELWEASDVPEKPSALEWPEPPPGAAGATASSSPPLSEEAIPLSETDLQKASNPKVAVPAPPPVPRKPGNAPSRR